MISNKSSGTSIAVPTHVRIARNLRLLRACQQLSQQQIANVANMSRSCYAALENGTRQADVNTVVLLSEYYGISADRLLKEDLSSLYYQLLQDSPEHHRP